MKIMIGIPILDNVDWMFFLGTTALVGKTARDHEIELCGPNRCAIDRARQFIVDMAIKKNCDRLLFIDDDTLVPVKDTIPKLNRLLDEKENAVAASGFCYQRGYKYMPMVYRYEDLQWGKGTSCQLIAPFPEEPFQASAVGMGICMIDVPKLKEIQEKMPPCFGRDGMETEDFYFFKKAAACGFKTWVDPSLEAIHLGDRILVNSQNADNLRGQAHGMVVDFLDQEPGGRSQIAEVTA